MSRNGLSVGWHAQAGRVACLQPPKAEVGVLTAHMLTRFA